MAGIHITDIEAAINYWREQKPSSKPAAAQNMKALMTNKNSPSVKNVTGKVNTTKAGRTMRLKMPITKAAVMAEPKLVTSTPL